MESTTPAASASANDHEAASGPPDGQVSSEPIAVPSVVRCHTVIVLLGGPGVNLLAGQHGG
jgi:hypothetical protein